MLRPLAAALLAACTLAVPATAAMPTVATKAPVERLASYEPQTTCSPTAKTGVTRFSASVLKAYAGTGSFGIVRGCTVGGRSEHKEGRAWDWKVSAESATQRAQAHDLMRWLFATDASGQRAANARRVGLMYLIFDRKIWSAYSGGTGWRAYGGANPHTDHMHLSFSWAGAKGSTSWFRVAAPPAPSEGPAHPAPRRRSAGPEAAAEAGLPGGAAGRPRRPRGRLAPRGPRLAPGRRGPAGRRQGGGQGGRQGGGEGRGEGRRTGGG